MINISGRTQTVPWDHATIFLTPCTAQSMGGVHRLLFDSRFSSYDFKLFDAIRSLKQEVQNSWPSRSCHQPILHCVTSSIYTCSSHIPSWQLATRNMTTTAVFKNIIVGKDYYIAIGF